jgi:hypothetical protein
MRHGARIAVLRNPWVVVGGVIAVAVVLPVVMAALSGNLAIPHDDAWAYSKIAQSFARTGNVSLVGWNAMFAVGQVVALGPLGKSIVAQQVFIALLAAGSIVATFALLRLSLPPRRAAFGTAVVAAFPGFGLLATSFMIDIPPYFAAVVGLLLGRVALTRRSPALLGLAVLVGMWGFTMREEDLAAVVCVLVAAFVAWTDRAHRVRVIALSAVTATGIVVLEVWRRSLANANGNDPISVSLHNGAIFSVNAFFTLGLLVLPALLIISRPRAWGASSRWAAGVTALLGLVFLEFGKRHVLLLGNYLSSAGAYSAVLPGTKQVLPVGVPVIIELGALVGGVLLAGEAIRGIRRLDLSLALFGLLIVVGLVGGVFANQRIFDRLLLPLVPVLLVMVLSDPVAVLADDARWRLRAAAGSLAALSALSLAITANGFAFDGARWSAAESLVHRGVSAGAIDAGLEWTGYHSPVAAVVVRSNRSRIGLPWYAKTLFPHARECFVMTSSPAPRFGRLVEVFHYRTFLVSGSSRLLLYDTGRCPGVRLPT